VFMIFKDLLLFFSFDDLFAHFRFMYIFLSSPPPPFLLPSFLFIILICQDHAHSLSLSLNVFSPLSLSLSLSLSAHVVTLSPVMSFYVFLSPPLDDKTERCGSPQVFSSLFFFLIHTLNRRPRFTITIITTPHYRPM